MYLTLHEAAERMGISYSKLYNRVSSGDFPATRIGNQWLIESDDVPKNKLKRVNGTRRTKGSKIIWE